METSILNNSELKDKVSQRYLALHQLYKHTDKMDILREAESALLDRQYEKADKILSQLRTREQLLTKLMQHLQHKSVHRTLERIMSGKTANLYESLKGLFSLGTHICIELEKGNMEYRGLLEEIMDSIQKNLGRGI